MEGAAVVSETLQQITRCGAFSLLMLKTNPWEEQRQFLRLHASLTLFTQNGKWIWGLEANECSVKGKALEVGVVPIIVICSSKDTGTGAIHVHTL